MIVSYENTVYYSYFIVIICVVCLTSLGQTKCLKWQEEVGYSVTDVMECYWFESFIHLKGLVGYAHTQRAM